MSGKLKTALELALERVEQNKEARTPLSHEQKQEIAEAQNKAVARLAEIEILHQSELAKLAQLPPHQVVVQKEKLQQNFLEDRRRIESERELKIKRIRNRR